MRYIPNTDENINSMLKEMGVDSVNDLFKDIPENLKLKTKLNLPGPLSEPDLIKYMKTLSKNDASVYDYCSFLGGGAYNHFRPSVIDHITGRSEYYTSYTPYEPEVSQGTLKAMFEYQTFMTMLTNMDVSNASMYDGASSTAEAVLMSMRIKKRKKIIISKAVHPAYREVIKTYTKNKLELIEIPYGKGGTTDINALSEMIDDDVAGFVIQSPNFFGVIEDLGAYEEIVHKSGSLFIVSFTEPVSLGLLKGPGDFNADIVCGEGQSFGIPLGFGGPNLGVLTTKTKFMREMPGRIVGKTVDRNEKEAFVLTLAAREQHIRRDKAKSNICSNQNSCTLTAAVWLSIMGKEGIRKLSCINHNRSEYAKEKLLNIKGIKIRFNSPTFNEFVVQTNKDPSDIVKELSKDKIIAGLPLKRFYNELSDCLLVTVTELNSKGDIDNLCSALKNI